MSLTPVVEEALAFLRPLIPPGVRVERLLAADCPGVSADSGQIHQVLINLATNAVHAMEAGSGTLTISLERVRLDERFATVHPPLRAGEHAVLTVQDTGCGMDAATLARLFEPFFTTKPPGSGTGLGMAVVLDIVKAHQGAIVVRSTVGAGTTFQLFFPQAEGTARVQTAAAPPARQGHGEHILFVDDEVYLVQMGSALLSRLGYQVSAFTDPELAIEAFVAAPKSFDALVTDLMMPGLPGTELIRRALQIRPDLPVIVTTGYTAPENLERVVALGPHSLLEKPYSADKLSDLLGQALGRPAAK
jgi:CheY-like chemotaxis protein